MKSPKHLEFFSDDRPGFGRRRFGRGFAYYDTEQKKISHPKTLDRIKSLVIPPLWANVWICPVENGYLQSTGKDAKNRKQYLYHQDWVTHRQNAKFAGLYDFGKSLPLIRKSYQKNLKAPGWPKSRVLALIIYLLDNYYFRVGNIHYTQENNSYGITTLRRKHIREKAKGLTIKYKAKSGKLRNIEINNRKITKLISQISELPGYEIFRYTDDDGNLHNIDSLDINSYLREITGSEFTAKYFRTWGGSKLAFEFYDETIDTLSENPRLKFETTLIKKVAMVMGNTLNVCRKYYIHPTVLKVLVNHYPKPLKSLFSLVIPDKDQLDASEKMLLHLLQKENE